MSKVLYNGYRQACLDSSAPDLTSVNVKITAVSATYVYSAAHDFLDDVTGVIATTGNLASKTIVNGYFDAANPNLGSPAGGSTITGLILYHDTGTPSTSRLIAYTSENASGAALSVATDGTLITLNLHGSGLFRV